MLRKSGIHPVDHPRRRACGPAAVLAAAVLLTATGCDRAVRRSFAVRDSAGVQIIESSSPRWTGGQGWRLEAEPVLSAGGTDAQRRMRIAGVVALDDGGLAVADMAAFTLHFFDATGQPVRSVEPGDAPIMVRAITRLYRVGDELFLGQRGLEPTLVFSQTGEFLRAIDPPPVEGYSFIAQFQAMADGSILAIQPPQGLLPRQGEWTENAVFVRIPADGGAVARVLSLPAIRFARIPATVTPVAFGPVLAFAFGPDRLFAGYPQQYDIGEYAADGTLLRRIRRDWTPLPVDEALVEDLRNRMIAILDSTDVPDEPELREQPLSQIRELPAAETLPAHGRMILDRRGHLWVERVPPPPMVLAGPYPVRVEATPWDVYDPDGVWLGTVETPANVYITEIGDATVAGIRRVDGIESAVLYRLTRDSAGSIESEPGPAED